MNQQHDVNAPKTNSESQDKIERATVFLNALDLYEPEIPSDLLNLSVTFDETTLITSTRKGAYLNNGSLVTFVDGVQAQHKKDVLSSTLLAQLAANKQCNRYTNIDLWYQLYIDTLEKVGWIAQDFKFSQYEVKGYSFKADKVILDVLQAIASENEIAIVKETLTALQALSDDDDRLVFFDSQSHHQSNGNFQIISTNESDGNLSLNLGAFYFDGTKNTTKFLFYEFSTSSSRVFKGTESIVLNEEVYSYVRDQVTKKLGNHLAQNIYDLEI